MADITLIRRCFDQERVLYSSHARREMRREEFGPIADREVYEAVCAGEMIEDYLGDKPYPSLLIFGTTSGGRPLHVVCAHDPDENTAIVITAYQPDPARWVDHRRRMK